MFFGKYVEANFSFAAFHAHKKYGITLIGVQPKGQDAMLNPGPSHIMSETDICYYINTTKEEQSSLVAPKKSQKMTETQIRRELLEAALNTNLLPRSGNVVRLAGSGAGSPTGINEPEEHAADPHNSPNGPVNCANSTDAAHGRQSLTPKNSSLSLLCPYEGMNAVSGASGGGTGLPPGVTRQRRVSIMPVSDECMSNNIIPDTDDGEEIPVEVWEEEYSVSCGIHPSKYMKGYPAILPYTGFWSPQVYLIPDLNAMNSCCLNITQPCQHRPLNLRSAMDYKFPSKFVIIAAEYPTLALFNFIVPLRSHCRPRFNLNPVVLLLEQQPDAQFMEAMTCYPMVYYAQGSIERLDDVLRAGICRAEAVVVIGKESSKTAKEEYMADAQTIVAVQTLCKLFPGVSIITELTHPSNMRFMRFHASEVLESLRLTNKEKKAKREGSTLTSYLYRKPFAAGHVFSASMLDTLLYQAFVKPYMIGITNLLLGLQQNDKSGHLFSMKITEKELWIRTYGRLFQRLCSTTYEIPVGIYRYDLPKDDVNSKDAGVEITFENDSDSDGTENAPEVATYLHYVDMERERLDETVRQRMEQLGMKPKELTVDSDIMDLSNWDKASIQEAVNPRNDPLLKYEVMNEIPGGRFLMGTDAPDANHGENPSKTINIRPFHMDRYPVTVAHFKRFLRAKRRYRPETYKTGYSYVVKGLQSRYVDYQSVELDNEYPEYMKVFGANWKMTQGQGSDITDSMLHPVTHVSFDDAQAYCMWKKKRLPTEAEWEYASRGGLEEKRYPWGGKFQKKRCNLWQGFFPSGNSKEDGHALTSPVDAYPNQNSLGLYDMLGNVWEWTTSLYREKGMDVAKLKKGRTFVVKGCSFIDSSVPDEPNHLARVTARRGFIANFTAQNIGFRCALSDSDAQAMGIKRVPDHVEL